MKHMTLISFESKLLSIKDWTLIRLPKAISQQLSSRGMVMVEALIQDMTIKLPLEPDGLGSHWFRIMPEVLKKAGLKPGDTINVSIRQIEEWIEPNIPEDIETALHVFDAKKQWSEITTKARWEWIRWIRSTKNQETRNRRIVSACSMLISGKRRPCCFNYSICTESYVSKNGMLILNNQPPE